MADKQMTPDQIANLRRLMAPVKAALKRAGFNQRYVADRLGVSEPTVSKWLSGKQGMSYEQFHAVAALIGASPKDLMGGPEDRARLTRYEALAALAGAMNDDQLAALEAVARQLAGRPKP
jgi:transcriptional regulator with XRE-family HTH domain